MDAEGAAGVGAVVELAAGATLAPPAAAGGARRAATRADAAGGDTPSRDADEPNARAMA